MNSNQSSVKQPAWTKQALLGALCLAALLVAALAAGSVANATITSVTSSDPDWSGKTPESISHGYDDQALYPAIAINSLGEMAAVWSDERGSTSDIYSAMHAGGEGNWSAPPQVITTTAHDSMKPDLLAVGNQFFASWIEPTNRKVYVTELGSGEISALTAPRAPVDDSRPSLAATSDRLHVVFSIGDTWGIPDLYYASRPLASTSWTSIVRIYESPAPLGAWWPALATSPDGQTLHLVWEERTSSSVKDIKYINGTVSGGGVTWSTPPVVLSTNHTHAIRPDIAIDDDGNIHVIWTEIGTGLYDEQYVRYTRLDAGSDSWLPPRRVDSSYVKANKIAPTFVVSRIAVWTNAEDDQTIVCAAWYGFRNEDPMAEEALLTCSTNGGNIWSTTKNMSRSTTTAGAEISIRPAIAFDSTGNLHAVWQEFSIGGTVTYDYEIYYATGGVSGGAVYMPLVMKNH
jgi:hypothetical protein